MASLQTSTRVEHSSRRKFLVSLLGSGLTLGLGIPSARKVISEWQAIDLVRKFPDQSKYTIGKVFYSSDVANAFAIDTGTGKAILWEYATQRIVQHYDFGPADWHQIAWSPDKRYLLTSRALSETDVYYQTDLWDLSTQTKVFALAEAHKSFDFDMASWSPDGTQIALLSNGELTLRDAVTGKLVTQFQLKDSQTGKRLAIRAPAWAPDSQRIALAGGLVDETQLVNGRVTNSYLMQVSIWDPHTQSTIAEVFKQTSSNPFDEAILNWSPDGAHIAAFITTLTHSSFVTDLWFLSSHNAASARHFSERFQHYPTPILAWSPDSKQLAIYGYPEQFQKQLAIWRTADLQRDQTIPVDEDVVALYWPSNKQHLMGITKLYGSQVSLPLSGW